MIDIITSDFDNFDFDFSKLKNKSILITGASGLVGIYFLASIKKKQSEYNIKIYTWNRNLNTIFDPLFENCERIICDITDKEVYKTLPKFDCIIHSAGYGQPGKFLDDKIKTIEINTSVTINLIEKLNEGGYFLFISSSEVYSGLNKYHLTEEEIGITNTNHPRAAYIEGKRCGEAICNIYREKGKDIKVGRLSFSYGPGTQKGDTRVINSLILKGLNNDRIELLDNGSAIRTHCYISDIIEMFWNILLNGKDCVYNIGGIYSNTIYEIAEKIGKIFNKEIVIPETKNELIGNPKLVNISMDKYINEFGKTNYTSIEVGLEKTIKWQKQLNERN